MKPMLQRKSWREFQDAGLLWWTNRILHAFGWSIVFEVDKKAETVIRVYPARVRYRGFDGPSEDRGFRKLAKYLAKKGKELERESHD